MFSKKCSRLLEESTGAPSYGSTLDSSATEPKTRRKTKDSVLTSSCPAVLEPSKDASRPTKPQIQKTLEDSDSPPLNPWRTLVTCSNPEPSTRVPISSDRQSNEQQMVDEHQLIDEQQTIDEHQLIDEQQTIDEQTTYGQQIIHEQVNENLSAFSNFVYRYSNTAIRLRNSKFIYVFQLLFSIIPLSAIVMGFIFNGKCDEAFPTYGGITGIIGVTFTCFWMKTSCSIRSGQPISDTIQLSFLLIFLTFFLFVAAEMCVFAEMSASFDQHAPNYCDKTFYYFESYKLIATGVAAVLGTMLYLPGALQYLCFLCRSRPADGREEVLNLNWTDRARLFNM